HDAVAFLDHVVVLDGLADLAVQALFQLACGNRSGLHGRSEERRVGKECSKQRVSTKKRQIVVRVDGVIYSLPIPMKSYIRSFFFQAEDGIRDFHVTGVQTCALPISMTRSPSSIML